MSVVAVSGGFDDLRSRHIRLLDEASRLGHVHVLLWSDDMVRSLEGREPKFPQEERLYVMQAIRYVSRVTLMTGPLDRNAIPLGGDLRPDLWVVDQASDTLAAKQFCVTHGLACRVITDKQLEGFPDPVAPVAPVASGRKKVLVTGCYDWFHSGHVRFFEEVSDLGDLYVVVGHDANIRLLKGDGHPMFPQQQRRYMVQSVRYVTGAIVSSGTGWLDAEPEIRAIKPDIYAVNEDGDKPEKREYCDKHGLEYVVLKRLPKPGLPRRQSTALRGF